MHPDTFIRVLHQGIIEQEQKILGKYDIIFLNILIQCADLRSTIYYYTSNASKISFIHGN